MKKSFSALFAPKNVSNNQGLFTDENPSGYFSREELINYLNELSGDQKRGWHGEHLIRLFMAMKAGVFLAREPNHVIENGIESTWISYKQGKKSINLRIHHFSGMKQLIDDYSNGDLKITQTLEELYNEAIV